MARAAATTFNIDVHSVVRRYNRLLFEVSKAQSSGVSFTNPFDVNRLLSYIGSMRNFQSWIVSQPLLDCPETGPTEMDLPENPKMPMLENESMMDVINLIEIARDEISNSQSARMPTNLIKFDYDRQQSYLAKVEQLLTYIAASEPLDLPESSPMADVTGPGRMGVNP
jgi:hypothetical protein